MKRIYGFLLVITMCLLPGVSTYKASAQNNGYAIYRVTTASLKVREQPGQQSNTLFSIPKDSYVLNFTSSQSQETEEINGRTGRWIQYCGMNDYSLGYIFEGFLEQDDDAKYVDVNPYATITASTIETSGEKFTYTDKTPLAGAWFQKPETESGDMAYLSEKNPRLLKKILASGGANIVLIVKDNKVLQIISTPPPRGYE